MSHTPGYSAPALITHGQVPDKWPMQYPGACRIIQIIKSIENPWNLANPIPFAISCTLLLQFAVSLSLGTTPCVALAGSLLLLGAVRNWVLPSSSWGSMFCNPPSKESLNLIKHLSQDPLLAEFADNDALCPSTPANFFCKSQNYYYSKNLSAVGES